MKSKYIWVHPPENDWEVNAGEEAILLVKKNHKEGK
jgi:hypothetical protein